MNLTLSFKTSASQMWCPSSLSGHVPPCALYTCMHLGVTLRLCKVTYSDATRGIFSEAGISCEDGGSLVLYREGIELGNISLKSLNDSEELESEVAQWLSGSYPMDAGGAQACPAPTGHAMGDAERTPVASPVPGQTPGVTCGAAPKGPPPGPKPPSSQPTSTVTFGAALSGPPPGPKVAASPVPGQTPGVMCGAAPKGPPPGPKPPSSQPTSTVTFGAALSGPPPGPKVAASPVPGQTPGVMCGAAPKGPPPGPKPPSSQPTSTVTFGAALSGPPPGPKVAASPVPGQTPGVMCGAAPKGPPPGPKPPSSQPTSTVTFGAALSGPPPGPKVAASPVPGQTPGVTCGAAPKGPPPGPKPPSSQPASTVTFGAALAGPPPGPKAAGSPVPGQTPGPARCEAKGDEAADLVDDADIRAHAPDCHQVTKLISMHLRLMEALKILMGSAAGWGGGACTVCSHTPVAYKKYGPAVE
ncbi:unnamed protein product [Symbiodinium natans]|uniref:Uncharacterized protein n=1 Tax=Symbiodinium natans TaxID=878477 RepID=A0A812R1T1_9DINO|nr:unnamed protein product [Symbiodinium natans]